MKNLSILLFLALLFSGCAAKTKTEEAATTVAEPLEEIQSQQASLKTEGSLWSNDETSVYSDEKARKIGDIINVVIAENASATNQATTATDKTSSFSAGITNLFGLENGDQISGRGADRIQRLGDIVYTDVIGQFEHV